MQKDYKTQYPSKIRLQNNQVLALTLTSNRDRVLITEVSSDIKKLRDLFAKHGFEDILLTEIVKPKQIGSGMRKYLDTCWDIHVRFFQLHKDLIAIDAEVETNSNFVEHIMEDSWISVLYEIWVIILEIPGGFYLFHKSSNQYVNEILSYMEITLHKTKEKQTEWKPIVAVLGILVVVAALLRSR